MKFYRSSNASRAVIEHQNCVREVASILEALDPSHSSCKYRLSIAGVLLRHFRWDTQKLLDSFTKNPEETCRRAGVTLMPHFNHPDESFEHEVTCTICFDKYKWCYGLFMSCGHWFCFSCWRSFLEIQIQSGPVSVYASCPAVKCKEVVHEDVWNEVLIEYFNDEEAKSIFNRYSTFLVRSFIDLNPSIKWCPSPHCNRAVQYIGRDSEVLCNCGFKICFVCGLSAHSPASCQEVKQWDMECDGDGRDLRFILKISKQCPNCKIAIQRISGCNHIVCGICKHQFCWSCLGDWNQHGDATGGFYECNVFETRLVVEQDKEEPSSLGDRLSHFYDRYENHEQCRLFAVEKKKQIEVLLEDDLKELRARRLRIIRDALAQLNECRRILKFSYVSLYFMEEGSRKKLFEHLQEMLEKNTDYLQELCEDIDTVNCDRVRTYTRLNQKLSIKLLEDVKAKEQG